MAKGPDHSVTVLLQKDSVVVQRIEIQPGGTIPRHKHTHDYVVQPLVDGHIRKSTYAPGQAVHVEEIDLTPGRPYWIVAPGPNVETSSFNPGPGVVIMSKIVVLRPKPKDE
jgi:hypothetical protein